MAGVREDVDGVRGGCVAEGLFIAVFGVMYDEVGTGGVEVLMVGL